MSKQEPIYFTEPRTSGGIDRIYVWYITPGSLVTTLFDICESQEKADAAIKLHKRGEHPTQWEPNKEQVKK